MRVPGPETSGVDLHAPLGCLFRRIPSLSPQILRLFDDSRLDSSSPGSDAEQQHKGGCSHQLTPFCLFETESGRHQLSKPPIAEKTKVHLRMSHGH
jgi:hypothetical protein